MDCQNCGRFIFDESCICLIEKIENIENKEKNEPVEVKKKVEMVKLHLVFKCHAIEADHSGYCSGNECEDEEEFSYFCHSILVNKKYEKIGNQHKLFKKYYKGLRREDRMEFETPTGGGGSGYCGSSPSGLKHETRYILKYKTMFCTDTDDACPYCLRGDTTPSGIFEVFNYLTKTVIYAVSKEM